jgi:myo-inositol-1(or 4)-monophosphatase
VPLTDAELAVAAAQAGAAVARSRYGGSLSRLAKSALDFATDADIEAEQAITAVLRAARPDDGILGEELGASGSAGGTRTWLVDPICGTANFAARTPLVAVNVALRAGDRVIAAAAADPIAGEIFWTDGQETWRRTGEVDEPLVPDATSRLVDLNLDPPQPNAPSFTTARLLSTPEFAAAFQPRVLSTTLALAWLAAGRRAAYVTDGDLRDSVHFAAGIALCQAAGCIVTDLFGEPVLSGDGGLIAAADQRIHDALRTIVDTQFAR